MWLDKILTQKQLDLPKLTPLMPDTLPLAQGSFVPALRKASFAIMAEMKAKSPSQGELCTDYNPVVRARQYVAGGATAISVLTDTPFFGGSFADLEQVTAAVDMPVLCKDFIIDPQQIYHARQAGAEAVLLIVRILTDAQLQELAECIESLGMTALVEVFDALDIERALAIGPQVIGINNRNLDSLSMDTNHSTELSKLIPKSIFTLSLSGIERPEDIRQYTQRCDGVLLGTALMKSDDPTEFLQQANCFLDQ